MHQPSPCAARRSARFPLALLALVLTLASSGAAYAHTTFVLLYDDWKYDGSGTDLGTAWRVPGFDDSGWSVGEAPIGAAASSYMVNVSTQIPIAQQTTYFRIAFDLDVPVPSLTEATLTVGYAHGFVAWLNGQEIARRSMPPDPIDFATPATSHVPTALEAIDVADPTSVFVSGKNVLAVEVHQTSPPSDILLWAAQLTFSTSVEHVTRGPFLQMASPSGMMVKWRTGIPTDSVVSYGLAPMKLDQTASQPGPTTEHEVSLTGLTPGTKYYYAIGSSQAVLEGADEGHAFVTSPAIGTPAPTRIWTVGDSGTQQGRERQVRDGYYEFTADRRTDLWLLLGDNAYGEGTDEQYQYSIFEKMYEPTLRSAAVWPTIGNHDWQDGTDVPYFDVFTLPTKGESGGVPSGTERYYAFDHANVHFVCLHTDIADDPAMLAWLEQDLAATTQPWLVAFLHKPPYTKGSHDSDHEGDIDWVHADVNPILEKYGADVVLGGHSHVYERSILISGQYGPSPEFAADPASFTIQGGDGREDGDGAYTKPAARGPGQGTVYVVNGNSGGRGDFGEFPLDHPVMIELLDPHYGTKARGMTAAGSFVLDVDGGRLDGRYVDYEGTVLDSFTILKDGTDPTGAVGSTGAGGSSASSGGGSPPTAEPTRVDSGCGCRTVGGTATSWPALALLAAFATLGARRRRCSMTMDERRRRAGPTNGNEPADRHTTLSGPCPLER